MKGTLPHGLLFWIIIFYFSLLEKESKKLCSSRMSLEVKPVLQIYRQLLVKLQAAKSFYR